MLPDKYTREAGIVYSQKWSEIGGPACNGKMRSPISMWLGRKEVEMCRKTSLSKDRRDDWRLRLLSVVPELRDVRTVITRKPIVRKRHKKE